MTKSQHLYMLAISLGAAGFSLPASAQVYSQSATATFDVTLTIQADCTIAANPLNFGTTGGLDTAIDGSSTLAVTCTNTTPYNVGLSAGNVSGSTISNRLLAGTAQGNTGTTVAYQLYQDAGRSTVWGDTQGTDTVSGVGDGTAQSIPVYGRVPSQTTPAADTYVATVTATVYF